MSSFMPWLVEGELVQCTSSPPIKAMHKLSTNQGNAMRAQSNQSYQMYLCERRDVKLQAVQSHDVSLPIFQKSIDKEVFAKQNIETFISTTQDTTVILKSIQYYIVNKYIYRCCISKLWSHLSRSFWGNIKVTIT